MTTDGNVIEDTIPMPEGALTINGLLDGNSKVDFTISQIWSDEHAGLAIEAGLETCVIKGDVAFGGSEEIRTLCVEGNAGVTVVVYLDENFEPDECEACNVDDLAQMGGNNEFCAYRVEIPCKTIDVECPSESPSTPSPTDQPTPRPTNQPTVPTDPPTHSPSNLPSDRPSNRPTPPTPPPTDSPTPCPPSDAIFLANEGETMYPDIPIEITFQNTTHVGFKVENTFGSTASSVFTEYHYGDFGETECLEEENVKSVVETEFLAQCMKHTKLSIVNVWIEDCFDASSFLEQTDNAEIPECCNAGQQCRTVQYTFKLPCEDPCPTENGASVRHLSDIKQEGSAEEFETFASHDEPNDAEDHFCVVEDYPCGPENDKVHVCHYSARDGYKTFCVPEADSDALRFYPKDYCGPCVGGYALE